MGGTVIGSFAGTPSFFRFAIRAGAFGCGPMKPGAFFYGKWEAILQLHNFYAMAGHSFFAGVHMPSIVVAHIDYNTESATLRITYTSGAIYEYLHVLATIYAALKSSVSKGIYLNKFIKGIYPYKKIASG